MPRSPPSFERSFANHPKSEFWNKKKNEGVEPKDVYKGTPSVYWFTCGKCEHDFDQKLSNITSSNGHWCPYCANQKLCGCEKCVKKSFAEHDKSVYWNDDKNGDVKPWNVFKGSDKICWFTCEECNHDFESSLSGVTGKRKRWCPFCSNQKLCGCEKCVKKSFAEHDKSHFWHDKNDIKPENVFMMSHKKYWFNCGECAHEFESILSTITNNGSWCPYCANLKLCSCDKCIEKSFASHDKSKYWNLDKNKGVKPENVFKNCNKKFWFTCEKCKHDFESSLNNIVGGKWCPICKKKTERKLYEFLQTFSKVLKEYKKDWCKNVETNRYLPFDFCIEELKIIIELDGRQHFEHVRHWKNDVDKQQKRDVYKTECANENGYFVIRILQEDVWMDKFDWKTELKELIDGDLTQNHFMCKNDEYDHFICEEVV